MARHVFTGPGPGRPKGCTNKMTTDLKRELLAIWEALQQNPQTSLLALAKAKPKWFYELFRVCFPKELHIETSIERTLSDAELDAQINKLLDKREGKPLLDGAETHAIPEIEH
jgi:hypothetical protein